MGKTLSCFLIGRRFTIACNNVATCWLSLGSKTIDGGGVENTVGESIVGVSFCDCLGDSSPSNCQLGTICLANFLLIFRKIQDIHRLWNWEHSPCYGEYVRVWDQPLKIANVNWNPVLKITCGNYFSPVQSSVHRKFQGLHTTFFRPNSRPDSIRGLRWHTPGIHNPLSVSRAISWVF